MPDRQPDLETPQPPSEGTSRRTVLRTALAGGAVLPVVAACGSESGSGSGSSSGKGSSGSPATVAASEVPVGGGTVLGDAKVVVTQPTKGKYKAFSAVCTHQGCVVAGVEANKINCRCHGSVFSAEDGSVVKGPATQPLAPKKVSATGGQLEISG